MGSEGLLRGMKSRTAAHRRISCCRLKVSSVLGCEDDKLDAQHEWVFFGSPGCLRVPDFTEYYG